MRKTLLFLLLLSINLTYGQFSDNFNDGNFTANPVWDGQTSQFSVNSAKQLKSSLSAVAQTISLATSTALALNVKWEFSIQLNFDPSTTNLVRIYLIADQSDLKGNLNGYFLQVGESGTADSYDLYKQTGNSVVKIIDGLPKNRVNINFLSTKIRVTRDDFGKWEVYTSIDDSSNYVLEGRVTDIAFTTTSWFGIYCRYTATRSEGFVFDDFNVAELVADITPPQLQRIKFIDEHTLEVIFSEAITHSSALIANSYKIQELNINPVSVQSTGLANVFRLTFARFFESGQFTLEAIEISDVKGNRSLNTTASIFYIRAYAVTKGDLVINEIFADPTPSIGLPAAEFVELWNITDKYILLKDWKYKDLTTTHTFSTDTLAPNSYVILCATGDENLFKTYGKTLGISTWPSLNNDKDKLSLLDPQQLIIDEVSYSEKWYKDGVKVKGGFSLELIDPSNRCTGTQNWQGSTHTDGGTPGVENSVYRVQIDSVPPKIRSASVVDETTIKMEFNKSIDSLSGSLISNYTFNNGIGSPLAALPQSPYFESVVLTLDKPIIKGQDFSLTINNLTDCAGGLIDSRSNMVTLFMAKAISKNDILISEILINPKLGGVEFIEIYNASEHLLDLSTLKLANIDGNGNIVNQKSIASSPTYLPSKTYWVLAREMENIKQHYYVKNPTNFTKMTSLPVYNNEKGTVILTTDQIMIDRFDYHENMHFPLLQLVKGVSLERISFQNVANEKGNFKSAAQVSGFATPTYKNSQEADITKNQVSLSSDVFSPDGDGFDDNLRISYQLAEHDYVANVTVYTDKGILIKKILNNATIPKEGELFWDGLNDRGALCLVGIYVIKFEVFALNGKIKRFEKTCALGATLK